MREEFKQFKILFSILLLLIMASCGKSDGTQKVEFSEDNEAIPSNNSLQSSIGANYIFDDESVNNANISYDNKIEVLTLQTVGGINPMGSFQGGGKGNKPIAALEGFNGVKLTDFSISWDYDQGQSVPWMNLLIDIDDDGEADHIVVPLSPTDGSFSFSGQNDSFRVVCLPTCGDWSSSLYDIDDFPNAKIVDSTIADGGMPAEAMSESVRGVIFSAGSGSSETSALSAEVFNIRARIKSLLFMASK